MTRRAAVAIFVPHAGCPHACSFCDQRRISGGPEVPGPEEVRRTLAGAAAQLDGNTAHTQIAFFGGSFTAIPKEGRRALLEAAQPFLRQGGFSGIRVSTRPDCIDEAVLAELKGYGVEAVELGAQSMDGRVLRLNRRGHTAGDVAAASRLIRGMGFSLGLQMMTGLYGDTCEGARETARAVAALEPDEVRVYPTVVLRGTHLEELLQAGAYHPQRLEEAVELCAGLLDFFHAGGIPVIRLGLHDSPSLKESLVAGPYHPAFRELCEGALLLERAVEQIDRNGIPSGAILLTVAPGSTSKMAGQRRANLIRLAGMGYRARIRESSAVDYLQVMVERA